MDNYTTTTNGAVTNKTSGKECLDLFQRIGNMRYSDRMTILENFKQALDFMNQVGEFCENINHHPNWYNSYNVVKIELTTHDIGGLSNLDFKLAKKIDLIYNSFGK